MNQKEKYVPPHKSKVRYWGQSLEAFKYNISEETKNEIQKKLFDEDTKEREWKNSQEKKERELRKSQEMKDCRIAKILKER